MTTVENPVESSHAASILEAARLESLADESAPALAAGHEVRGGASVFENQAACPFRAFAIHRLGARALEEGHPGLDARERGTLLHRALAHLWGELETQSRLLAMDAPDLDATVARAVNAAIESVRRDRPDAVSEPFAVIERERLQALIDRLITQERARAPFRVVEREAPRALDVAGLRMNARVDRIDMLDDGSRVILDYKTGKATVLAWLGERPDAPQLPLYAVTDPGEVAAVAFVPVRALDVRFNGLSRDEALLPGVKTLEATGNSVAEIRDWPALLWGWRTTLDALASEFLAGHAAVLPKKYPKTCQYCELGALCRVKERFDRGPVSVEEEPISGAGDD